MAEAGQVSQSLKQLQAAGRRAAVSQLQQAGVQKTAACGREQRSCSHQSTWGSMQVAAPTPLPGMPGPEVSLLACGC
jgi:hypothetical protein